MALNDHDAWVPEEFGGPVIQKIAAVSAVEALARPENMNTDTRHVPRSGGIGLDVLDKGEPYTEDATSDDDVELRARKFGRMISLAHEDIEDVAEASAIDIVNVKKVDWATTYAKGFDNACLGTTATQSMGAKVPFYSVYYTLRNADSDLGYGADDNYVASAAIEYSDLSEVLGLYEDGDWFDAAETVVIASPAFKRIVRDVVDDNHRPIFIQGTQGTPDTLFGYQVAWTQGARTSSSMTPAPSGNPLLVVCNRQLLIKGVRSGPESYLARADSGIGFMTDEAYLKMRARRAFAVGHPKAFAVLESTAS